MRPHLEKKLSQGPHVLQHIASGMFLQVVGWSIEWGKRADSSCPLFTSENMGPARRDQFHVDLYRRFRRRSRGPDDIVPRCGLALPGPANAALDERDRLANAKERADNEADILSQAEHVAYVRNAIQQLKSDFEMNMADLSHELTCAEANLDMFVALRYATRGSS